MAAMEQFDISQDTSTLLDDLGEDGQDGDTAQDKAGEGPQTRLIGYRWLAGRGKEACPKCAALHNKVFYKHPEPGQASIDDMPKGQLHPNCGCTTKPVVKWPDLQYFKPTIKPYMVGKIRRNALGALVREEHLNSLGEMPIYGKYCGDYWTSGRDVSHDSEQDINSYDPPSDDDMDELCKMHDLAYDSGGRDSLEADRALLTKLRALDPDPSKWRNPPETEEDIEYARWYRAFAILAFHFRIRNAEIEEWLNSTPLGSPPLTI